MQLATTTTTARSRLGDAIYWIGIFAGIFTAPFIGWTASHMGLWAMSLFGFGAFAALYVIGLGARYILAGY
jgi:hypothetical protein